MHADTPAACENCQSALQGAYCHVCGQHAANPMRHFGHALEDVFESFWHLDGRVFRTLRELFIPGRVASNYLAGHRVRYIPPLRLFVIVSLLTFFFGRMLAASVDDTAAVRFDDPTAVVDATRERAFTDAGSEAEVRRQLDERIAAVRTARENLQFVPTAGSAMQEAERQLRADADARIAELAKARGTAPAAAPAGVPANANASAAGSRAAPAGVTGVRGSPPSAASAPSTTATTTTSTSNPASNAATPGTSEDAAPEPDPQESIDRFLRENMPSARLRDPALRWHPETNPASVTWLPAMLDPWFNRKLRAIGENARRYSKEDGHFIVAFVAAMPTALFLMMPVFALLLKLFYVRHRHGVLEHLVVALYSHVFLLLAVLCVLLLRALTPASGGVESALPGLALAGLLIYVPVYLLLMQRRVYAQSWPKTILKYVLIGGVYFWLLLAAAVFALLLPFLGSPA